MIGPDTDGDLDEADGSPRPNGSPPRERGRARARLGRRIRLRLAVRPARLRGRRRLADPVGVAVPVRSRVDLGFPGAVSPIGAGRCARSDRRAVLAGIGLGVLYVGNSGTYYASLETVSPSLAALVVYLYPAVVAVLAIRFGHRLAGPAGVDRAGHRAHRRRARGRRHRPERRPADQRPAARLRLVLHLRGLGDPRSADLGRATWIPSPTSRGRSGRRPWRWRSS